MDRNNQIDFSETRVFFMKINLFSKFFKMLSKNNKTNEIINLNKIEFLYTAKYFK